MAISLYQCFLTITYVTQWSVMNFQKCEPQHQSSVLASAKLKPSVFLLDAVKIFLLSGDLHRIFV